ncbi:MAG: hypothetical protein KF891_15475 [Rhizobacter sp.]|nr:hypothetical protein [Rhizobacter sp.]
MRLLSRGEPVPANAVVVNMGSSARGDFSRLLGAEPVASVAAAPQASSRFRLLGVMAAKPGPQGTAPGVALISIDGKPARAFAAGAHIEDQLVLQNVSLRTASIGVEQGPTSFVLEIPALPPPATGTLPKPTFQSATPAMPAPGANTMPALSQRPMPSGAGAPPSPAAQPPGGRVLRPGAGNPNAAR